MHNEDKITPAPHARPIRRAPRPLPLWERPELGLEVAEYVRELSGRADEAHAVGVEAQGSQDPRQMLEALEAIMDRWVRHHTGGRRLDHRYAWQCLAGHVRAYLARNDISMDLQARAEAASRARERRVSILEITAELELLGVMLALARHLYGQPPSLRTQRDRS